jgi:hypothetical protein
MADQIQQQLQAMRAGMQQQLAAVAADSAAARQMSEAAQTAAQAADANANVAKVLVRLTDLAEEKAGRPPPGRAAVEVDTVQEWGLRLDSVASADCLANELQAAMLTPYLQGHREALSGPWERVSAWITSVGELGGHSAASPAFVRLGNSAWTEFQELAEVAAGGGAFTVEELRAAKKADDKGLSTTTRAAAKLAAKKVTAALKGKE